MGDGAFLFRGDFLFGLAFHRDKRLEGILAELTVNLNTSRLLEGLHALFRIAAELPVNLAAIIAKGIQAGLKVCHICPLHVRGRFFQRSFTQFIFDGRFWDFRIDGGCRNRGIFILGIHTPIRTAISGNAGIVQSILFLRNSPAIWNNAACAGSVALNRIDIF